MNTSGTLQRDEEEEWKKCLESESCLKKGEMKRDKMLCNPFHGATEKQHLGTGAASDFHPKCCQPSMKNIPSNNLLIE